MRSSVAENSAQLIVLAKAYLQMAKNALLRFWRDVLMALAVLVLVGSQSREAIGSVQPKALREVIPFFLIAAMTSASAALYRRFSTDHGLLEGILPPEQLRKVGFFKFLVGFAFWLTLIGLVVGYGILVASPLGSAASALLGLAVSSGNYSNKTFRLSPALWQFFEKVLPGFGVCMVKTFASLLNLRFIALALSYLAIIATLSFFGSIMLESSFIMIFSLLLSLAIISFITKQHDEIGNHGVNLTKDWLIDHTIGEWLFWTLVHAGLTAAAWAISFSFTPWSALEGLGMIFGHSVVALIAVYLKYLYHGQHLRHSLTILAALLIPPLGLYYLYRIVCDLRTQSH